MAKQNAPLLAFNRGMISPLALARTDLDRTRLSAEVMTNWIPKAQGAMRIRPGTKYIGSSKNDTGATWIDFVAATDDWALLEITGGDTGGGVMRVWDTGESLVTRGTAATSIPTFASDTGIWTQDTGVSTAASYVDFSGGQMAINGGARGSVSKMNAKVAVDTGDINNEIGLNIKVERGTVSFTAGKTDTGDATYIAQTTLRPGDHYLSLTPTDTGDLHLSFETDKEYTSVVDSIEIASSGTVEVPTPWRTDDLKNIRWDQSADVMFLACDGYQQRRIERRNNGRSWSVVKYETDNGPFTAGRTNNNVKLRFNRYTNKLSDSNTQIVANQPIFTENHVGSLFWVFSDSYSWEFLIAGDGEFTDPIVVTGPAADNNGIRARNYDFRVYTDTGRGLGAWNGTISLMSSLVDKDDGPYQRENYSGGNAVYNITDTGGWSKDTQSENAAKSNLTEYVKFGFQPGDYTSGVAKIAIQPQNGNGIGYHGGGDYGIARIVSITNTTRAIVDILKTPARTSDTQNWREGMWSNARSWPTDVRLYEGRLWWFGQSYAWGSVSDDYANFDDEVEGDAAPIIRELGSGPIDNILFSVPLGRLLLGTAGGVLSLRSTAFDEPLTATNMSAKLSSTHGAAPIRAVRIDNRALYVHRSGNRLYEIFYDIQQNDYSVRELTYLNPEILDPGVVDMVVQRQPDTRVHCILSDGTVAILTYEPEQELLAWSKFTTDGFVEAAQILPGSVEDRVYYHVRRTISGATKRYLERWSMESESLGDTGLTYLVDCAAQFTNDTGRDGLTSSIGGFSHLAGESIICWANDTGGENDDGKDLSPDTGDTLSRTKYYVNAASDTGDTGKIALTEDVKHLVGGLEYEAHYKSAKLAYAAEGGTALAQMKRTDKMGLVLYQTHNNGLYFGSDSGNLDPLPRTLGNGDVADANKIHRNLDEVAMPFPGLWDEDSRIHLKAKAARPVTVMAAVPTVKTNEKI